LSRNIKCNENVSSYIILLLIYNNIINRSVNIEKNTFILPQNHKDFYSLPLMCYLPNKDQII